MATSSSQSIATPAEVERIARLFPSFRDFVDDALFHPRWGYYSTGRVRFGEGGHYDTFPLALSPLFGRMLAQYAYRFWRRAGQPARFELCELGAGNGQLCLDVLVRVAAGERADGAWARFARSFRYRIIERSSALIARQRQQLGPLAGAVTWTRADLAEKSLPDLPLGPCGLVFANEVLDCLGHHKVVPAPDGSPGVTFVVPLIVKAGRAPRGLVRGLDGAERAVPRTALARVFGSEQWRQRVTCREVVLPLRVVPDLDPFVRRHYPEFFVAGKQLRSYFACPAIERLVGSTARLYRRSEILWIDYGETRQFHLTTAEHQRIFAGPPRSGASVYRAPGRDDITFVVDFSVVARSAQAAGLRVKFYGGQGELARRSGVALDRQACDLILRVRTLGWMLALMGLGPEHEWRHTGLTWSKESGHGGSLRADINRAVAEFLGKRKSNFKLMILATGGDA